MLYVIPLDILSYFENTHLQAADLQCDLQCTHPHPYEVKGAQRT